MKKEFILLFFILISTSSIFAINLDVSVKPISDSFITDLNEPAVFDLVIKNFETDDDFQVYSLVGIDLAPKESFAIKSGESKTIRVNAVPQEPLRMKKGFLTFEYLIKNSREEIQKEKLSINIIDLKDIIIITAPNINSNSEKITITLKNTIMKDMDDLKIDLSSAFFVYGSDFPLKSLESKDIEILIQKDKLKSLTAGQYLINAKIETMGKIAEKEVAFKFLEEENIETTDEKEGFLIIRREIVKNNLGNVKKRVAINIEKDLISSIFTSLNIVPTKTEIKGFKKYYIWEKELLPSDQLKVVIKTNWFYPILIIILTIGVIILIRRYLKTDLVLKKNVSFVRTHGGEFALKVHIRIKARKYIERIKIEDKIPVLVNLYEKFGAVSPDVVDMKNKRLHWNIEALNPKEERIFSYIIYSKIGIVGRFELPAANAVYERDGEMKDAFSNRAFFVNEPEKRRL